MDKAIEVRVTGRGWVKGEEIVEDKALAARCTVCKRPAELVVAVTPEVLACRDCLRACLDATSVATWRLSQAAGTAALPWGKIAG